MNNNQTPAPAVAPYGYAYLYHDCIRFNNGEEHNGCKPKEAIPYWLGAAPAPSPDAPMESAPLSRESAGEPGELIADEREALQKAERALYVLREHNHLHFGHQHSTVAEAQGAWLAVRAALAAAPQASQLPCSPEQAIAAWNRNSNAVPQAAPPIASNQLSGNPGELDLITREIHETCAEVGCAVKARLAGVAPAATVQPTEPAKYEPCYVCGRPMDGLSEDDCHCFHRKETADECIVKKHDANTYCLILSALGMAEEGDALQEVCRLIGFENDALAAAPQGEALTEATITLISCVRLSTEWRLGHPGYEHAVAEAERALRASSADKGEPK